MNYKITVPIVSLLLSLSGLAQTAQMAQSEAVGKNASLEQQVERYSFIDGGIIDALAELSQSPEVKLHLGIEEILRERFAAPRERTFRFSISLAHKSVRQILDTLCASDTRYGWSMDGQTINVYPRTRVNDKTDLLNFHIDHLRLTDVPDPDQALTPLSQLFPDEQIGYLQNGLGDNNYTEPWTETFTGLTVRQLINRITEHSGSHTVWIWQGGKDGRMFTFLRGGFHTR